MSRIAFEVCSKRIVGEGDNKKTYWDKCGVVFENNYEGKRTFTLKLNLIPVDSNGSFYLFTPKRRDDNGDYQNNQTQVDDVVIEDIGDEPVNLDDIPF